jgi:hypothetical protein
MLGVLFILRVVRMVLVVCLLLPVRIMGRNNRCGISKTCDWRRLQQARVMRHHADRAYKCQRALHRQQTAQ